VVKALPPVIEQLKKMESQKQAAFEVL